MLHKQWLEEMKLALSLRDSSKIPEAISTLKRLVGRLQRNQPKDTEPWHQSETLALIGYFYEQSGDLRQAAKYYMKRAELNKGFALSHGMAAANSLGYASLCYFRTGQTQNAVKLARESLHLFGYYIDPSPTMEKVSTALREHYEKAARAKSKVRRKGK